jgi:alkylation response protein AidB-like acyl-CoA dehydrogenase
MGQVENVERWAQSSASARVAPDCAGLNFFDIDASLRDLLHVYLPPDLREHMTPHYARLGELAGGRLDALARLSDRHVPRLQSRDRLGRDEDWIEFHPAYREMEQLGYGEFGIHCMSRRPGVLGWPQKVPPVAKYVFQYLFAQSEFGLMCPISATETTALLIERYGSAALKAAVLPRMLSQDMNDILMGAQFMTEKTGGSDVSGIELSARFEDGAWRLYGDKWFCSCADADIALLLARPEDAPGGNGGLALFALPRRLEDGSRNHYRIVRLKDKLGSRSMASGEIAFEGAVVWPLGDVGAGPNRGLKQMMDQVNMSRLSHGVRAAAMMRRCMNEALVVARHRQAFGGLLIDKPLVRRQLAKLLLPTEQALSVALYTATQLQAGDAGDAGAARLARILTPLLKFRSARDNIKVATGAMEMRGGNGYIEEWVNARLVRDAHLGVLWEGTSNINAIDVVRRAVARSGAHDDLRAALTAELQDAAEIPQALRDALSELVDRAAKFAERIAREGGESLMRQAASALYHSTSAVLLAAEGARLGRQGRDARRLVLARMVLDHRLRPQDPLEGSDSDASALDALLDDASVTLARAQALVA